MFNFRLEYRFKIGVILRNARSWGVFTPRGIISARFTILFGLCDDFAFEHNLVRILISDSILAICFSISICLLEGFAFIRNKRTRIKEAIIYLINWSVAV